MYRLAELDASPPPRLLPSGDPGQWAGIRDRIRQIWCDYVGALPEPCPVTWRTIDEDVLPSDPEGEAVRMLHITYEAPPGVDPSNESVPAFLLIPESAQQRPAPAAVALHPTHERGKDVVSIADVRANRAYGLELAQRGYVVLAPDTIGSGERIMPGEQYWDTSGFYRRNPGWTVIGRMITDHRQAVSLLQSLDEVDASKIATIGHSLGGYNAVFAAALDERIKAVVTSCGTPMWGGDPNPQRWFRGQPFVHLPRFADDVDAGVVPFEWHEITALVAPRPLFIYAARNDEDFPHIDSIAAGVAEIKHLYSALGHGDSLEFLVGPGGHDFPAHIRQAAYLYLDRAVAWSPHVG